MLATVGLGALLRTSEWLFTAIKLAGAAYLLYLGVRFSGVVMVGLAVRLALSRRDA